MGDVSVDLTVLKGLIRQDVTHTAQDTTLTNYWNDARRFYDNKLAVHETLPSADNLYEDDAPDLIARLAAANWNYDKTPTDATVRGISNRKSEITAHLKARFVKRTEGTSARSMGKTTGHVTGFE
jgi:hypothetical protein